MAKTEQRKPLNSVQNALVGAVAGSLEVCIQQPTVRSTGCLGWRMTRVAHAYASESSAQTKAGRWPRFMSCWWLFARV